MKYTAAQRPSLSKARIAERKDKESLVILQAMQDAQCSLSAEGVAHYAGIEPSKDTIRKITARLWNMAAMGLLHVVDRRDSDDGLFFHLARIKNSDKEQSA